MNDSKNDIGWNALFKKYKIAEKIKEDGFYEIKSSDINPFRQARLMTKFDYKSQLPKIFKTNNLSILPISRGKYVISTFETYKPFKEPENIQEKVKILKKEFPNFIESIDPKNITSESAALNCAFISGMIEDFTGDEQINSTVNGRMSSNSFCFDINTKKGSLPIKVVNSQIEVDGGYEGVNFLTLVEAKNSISDDFLIRQMYYPFRLWRNIINKPIRSLFLTYTNGIFHFREYCFENPEHYNSLKLVKEKKYVIKEGVINLEVIQGILSTTSIISEPNIPFPQANSFERVINLCELLNENTFLTKDDITENYDFNARQTDYYTNAGRYLGLINKTKKKAKITFFLTKEGEKLFKLSITTRQRKFIELILSHSVFQETLKLYFQKLETPTTDEIVEIMKSSKLYNIGAFKTYSRRSSTILRWIIWILDQNEE